MKKSELKTALDDLGIEYPSSANNAKLKAILDGASKPESKANTRNSIYGCIEGGKRDQLGKKQRLKAKEKREIGWRANVISPALAGVARDIKSAAV